MMDSDDDDDNDDDAPGDHAGVRGDDGAWQHPSSSSGDKWPWLHWAEPGSGSAPPIVTE